MGRPGQIYLPKRNDKPGDSRYKRKLKKDKAPAPRKFDKKSGDWVHNTEFLPAGELDTKKRGDAPRALKRLWGFQKRQEKTNVAQPAKRSRNKFKQDAQTVTNGKIKWAKDEEDQPADDDDDDEGDDYSDDDDDDDDEEDREGGSGRAKNGPLQANADKKTMPPLHVARGPEAGAAAGAGAGAGAGGREKKKSAAKGERLQRLHESKLARRGGRREEGDSEDEAEEKFREKYSDHVGFNEVAMAPPTLTLKRKRGQDTYHSTGGGDGTDAAALTSAPVDGAPINTANRLGSIFAKQMAAAQAVQGKKGKKNAKGKSGTEKGRGNSVPEGSSAGLKDSSMEQLRLDLIAQYRAKRNRMPQVPKLNV